MLNLKLWLALRTLRYLRWEQIAYRPLRIAQSRLYRILPRLAAGRPPEIPASRVAASSSIIRRVFNESFAHLTQPLSKFDGRLNDLLQDRFTFLNRTLLLHPIDWNQRYESHLWNYQLHYFGWTVFCARAFVERGDERALDHGRRLIESWIDQARVGQSDGWDAYPVSLRTVEWIYAYSLVAEDYRDRDFLERWRESIYRQLDFLRRHLELHLMANHLLKNVKALVVGGLFFGEERWLRAGERWLWREFAEQVLPDGGHYERSPMYHAQTLVDFLECYALLRAFKKDTPAVDAGLRAMAGFLAAMSYPDGSFALFNDAAGTEETKPSPILASARRIAGFEPENRKRSFPNTGYYVWESLDGREKMIVDAGPPAVDYNTAHAHCDLLSYELRLNGKPFIVDSGVHGYGGDRFREYCRSTRAHNTVLFDGREQSEVWGTFRMARRAKLIEAREITLNQDSWQVAASYQPFYSSSMIHERSYTRSSDGEWRVEDRVRNNEAKQAGSYIHPHPDVRARIAGTTIECQIDYLTVTIEPLGKARIAIVEAAEDPFQGWYFPDFGIAQPAQTICFEYQIADRQSFGYRIVKKNRKNETDEK